MNKALLISLFLAQSVPAMPPAQRYAFPRQDGAHKYVLGHQFNNHWKDDCSSKQAGQKNFTKDMDCMIGSLTSTMKDACVDEAWKKVQACNAQQTTKQCIEGPWLEMIDCSNNATVPVWAVLNPNYKPDNTSTGQTETGATGNMKGSGVSGNSTSPVQAEKVHEPKNTTQSVQDSRSSGSPSTS